MFTFIRSKVIKLFYGKQCKEPEREQQEENLTNDKSAIAFVKTCPSLIHSLFTDGEENGGEENRTLMWKREVKEKDKYESNGTLTDATV